MIRPVRRRSQGRCALRLQIGRFGLNSNLSFKKKKTFFVALWCALANSTWTISWRSPQAVYVGVINPVCVNEATDCEWFAAVLSRQSSVSSGPRFWGWPFTADEHRMPTIEIFFRHELWLHKKSLKLYTLEQLQCELFLNFRIKVRKLVADVKTSSHTCG